MFATQKEKLVLGIFATLLLVAGVLYWFDRIFAGVICFSLSLFRVVIF
jgi:hypothetical protein